MFKLCKSYIVVVHLLLLFNIAHTFVLLTANVDDIKKIARRFVSDEIAEKIADFIARATESLSHQSQKASEEKITDNSQVSAENRMYNIERHGFDGSYKNEEKSKRENAVKNKEKTFTKKKDLYETDGENSKPKPRKETKGKSRYIIEDSTTTDKADIKGRENGHDYKMKDSIKMVENNLLGATDKVRTKKPIQKKKTKVKPYKLLTTYDSDEVHVVKYLADSKEKKEEEEEKRSQRAFDDEIAAIRNAAVEYDNDGKKKTIKPLLANDESEKYDTETKQKRFDDEIAAIKNAAVEYYNDSKKKTTKPLLVKDESEKYDTEKERKRFDDEIAAIRKAALEYEDNGNKKTTKKSEKVRMKNDKDGKWWEKELPKHKQDSDANLKHKSWF